MVVVVVDVRLYSRVSPSGHNFDPHCPSHIFCSHNISAFKAPKAEGTAPLPVVMVLLCTIHQSIITPINCIVSISFNFPLLCIFEAKVMKPAVFVQIIFPLFHPLVIYPTVIFLPWATGCPTVVSVVAVPHIMVKSIFSSLPGVLRPVGLRNWVRVICPRSEGMVQHWT